MARPNELALHLEPILPALRERVFHAFTRAEDLVKWWGPHEFTIPEVDFTPRTSGTYRIAMQPPDGDLFHLRGEFREVVRPERLVYTFRWDPPDPDDIENVVTLEFLDRGDSTVLVLHQAPFATDARLELHRDGWTESFGRLLDVLL